MRKLEREDFFGHPLVLKLTTQINKKTIDGFCFMYLKEKKVVKLLRENDEWLDVVGIVIE